VSLDKAQHCSWVTDLRVPTANVYQLMRGGRARWKIENETFNTLKNQGDNLDHTYGHGEQHLSVVLATLMMLALLTDQTQPLCCALFQAVWEKLGSKRLLWERMRALFFDEALQSMRQLLEALLDGFKKFGPQFEVDSSSFHKVFLVVGVTIQAIRASAIVTGSVRLGNETYHFLTSYGTRFSHDANPI
jgi:hypothetical protein